MTSDRQLSLFPACSNDARAALHWIQAVARVGADPGDRLQAQVGELSLLHVRPDVFDRVEFWGIRRKSFENELVAAGLDVAAHQAAFVTGQAVQMIRSRPLICWPSAFRNSTNCRLRIAPMNRRK